MTDRTLSDRDRKATASTVADRLRHRVRRPISRTPYVWDLAMLTREDKRRTLVRRDSALVIEGFLRSGNTYSVAAFRVANGSAPHVARHLHGAPHLLRAARLGIPAVVLVRDPRDAVSSYLVRRPSLHPRDGLLEYLDFYRTAWRVRDSFLVAGFEDVTQDFGQVVHQVNERFGTSFRRYERTPENEAAAFALVEEMNREECGGELVETHVGRPSAERKGRRQELDRLFAERRTAGLLETAAGLYQQYLALRPERSTGASERPGPR